MRDVTLLSCPASYPTSATHSHSLHSHSLPSPLPSPTHSTLCPLTTTQCMNATDWEYKSEGNANVVFTYKRFDSSFKHKVLRLSKEPKSSRLPSSGLPSSLTPPLLSPSLPPSITPSLPPSLTPPAAHRDNAQLAEFHRLFISTLFGERYSCNPTAIPIDSKFISGLQRKLDTNSFSRPANRRQDRILESQTHAILMPDFTVCPNSNSIVIELKPKWGAKPLAPENITKSQTCRFCMYQVARQKRNFQHIKSAYCPLDLFSGSKRRIDKAISALFATPQNNLRAFRNNKQVDPPTDINMISWPHNVQTVLSHILFSDPLLRLLRQAQQFYDPYDITGVNTLYERYLSETSGKFLSQPFTIDMLNDAKMCRNFPLSPHPPLSTIPLSRIPSIIRKFLLSATLRDVSILIAIQPGKIAPDRDRHYVYQIIDGMTYSYAMNVIDADIKPVERIRDYLIKDKSIVEDFIQSKIQKECK